MTQHAIARCSALWPPALRLAAWPLFAGLLMAACLMSACGPREPPPEIPPPTQSPTTPVAPVAVSDAAADTSKGADSTDAIPNATVTATIQGDPFAQVDVAADERLRQILRVSDKARPPAGKAPAAIAPRPQNPAPATPAEPARLERQAETPASAPAVQPAAAPQQPTPVENAAPAAAAPTTPAEPPRPPSLRAIDRSQPPFPVEAQRQGVLSGRVIAAITVQPDGTVGQVDIVESTPQRVFDRAVRNTLLRWRFEPVPQQVRANVEIVFNAE